MSRFGSFAKAVSTSWCAIAVSTAYSLATVPLALHYLGAERFGAWALLLQIYGYFVLLEFGMTGASARILIDHKDDKESAGYAETVSTSNFVFLAQSVLIFLAGWLSAPAITGLFAIPAPLQQDFEHLVILSALVAGLAAATRLFGSLLYANQRIDLVNWSSSLGLVAGLAALWIAFEAGAGLYALAVSQAATWAAGSLLSIVAARKLGLFRWRGLIRKVKWARAKELIDFGKDMFAFNLGSQVLDASQVMIVSRTMGLEAAAAWAVSTKLFTLVYQLVTRVEGTAVIFFAEMIVRGEKLLLSRRFRQVYQISVSLAASAAALAVATNGSFVALWASSSLAWPWICDLLAAILLIANCAIRCGADLIIHTKNMSSLRTIYFVEAMVFLGLALAASNRFGLAGVLAAALLCALLFRGLYISCRVSDFLERPKRDIAVGWIKRGYLLAVTLLPLSAGWSLFISSLQLTPAASLSLSFAGMAPLTLVLLTGLGLPRDTRGELLGKLRLSRTSVAV